MFKMMWKSYTEPIKAARAQVPADQKKYFNFGLGLGWAMMAGMVYGSYRVAKKIVTK